MNLSKEARQILSDNGYQLKLQDNTVSFNYSSFDRWFIVIAGGLLTVISSILVVNSPFLFVVIVGAIGTATFITYKRATGKFIFTLFFDDNEFHFSRHQEDISPIQSVQVSSKPLSGYGVAYNEYDEEHQIMISIQTKNNSQFELLVLKSDEARPSGGVKEIIDLLESAVDFRRQLATSVAKS